MNKKFLANIFRSTLTLISPELNTKIVYFFKNRKIIDWNNPQTFSEKLLKLKIENYNTNAIVHQCADKYRVREYIKQHHHTEILNEIIALYDNPEDINWQKLPNKFVIKLNYGCGYNIICNDKTHFNFPRIKKQLNEWMNEKPWLGYAELQYKDVPPKIIIEKYLEDKNANTPEDYKIYCFNGQPQVILYISGRFSRSVKAGFFDLNWNYLGKPKKDYLSFDISQLPSKPQSLENMILIAKELSNPFPFVRIDFYEYNNQPIFGEMTFTPAGAFDPAEIEINGKTMGEILELDI